MMPIPCCYGKASLLALAALLLSFRLTAQTDTSVKDNLNANLKTTDTTAPAVYKIRFVPTIAIGAAATAANMIAINNILHNKKDLTPEEVFAARRDIVNPIDRWALNFDPEKRDHYYSLSDKSLTGTLILSAATFVLNKKTRKDWLRLGLMYYQTQFLTFAFYDFSPLGPSFQNRLRPVVYYDYFSLDHRREGRQRNSLYSGHVANATAATFFAVKVYLDYHPEMRRKKFLLYGLASIPPLFGGWLRMKALAHFPSDVLTGYAIGGVFGVLIPEMHRIKSDRLAMTTYADGLGGGVRLAYKLGGKKMQSAM